MLLIARIRRSMRIRKDQLLGFLLKLDFGNNDTLKNAAVNIDTRSLSMSSRSTTPRGCSQPSVEMILWRNSVSSSRTPRQKLRFLAYA
jgi:hypothetical protein